MSSLEIPSASASYVTIILCLRTGACPELYHIFQIGETVFFGFAGGENDVDYVVFDFVVDVNLVHDFAGLHYFIGRDDGID